MTRRGKRTPGLEEAHPFTGMSRINQHAAGVEIGAVEIVVCVAGDESSQIVIASRVSYGKAFGN